MNVQAASATVASPIMRSWPWLALILLTLAIAIVPLPGRSAAVGFHDLQIEAGQYEFSPAVIKVNQGDRVTINLVSTDVIHGLYLDGYELEVTADPGQSATLSFVANKSGTFRFRCSVVCGPLHPFMIGKLKVGNNTLLWRGLALSMLAAFVGLWRVRQ
jgi:heme/copper-type cytochrome/quinol oxidase subunit 2